jgi:hypothetical protein
MSSKYSASKKQIIAVVSFLAMLGVADVIARVLICGNVGFEYALHDPGKNFFHIIILPLVAVVVLTKIHPVSLYRKMEFNEWPGYLKAVVGSFLGMVILSGIWGAYMHEEDWRCSKLRGAYLMPFDVYPNQAGVDSLKQKRSQIDDMFHSLAEHKSDSTKRKGIAAKISKLKSEYVELSKKHCPDDCSIWKVNSPYTYLSVFETLVAVVFVGYLFSAIVLFAIQKRLGGEASTNAVTAAVAVISPWILLRTYSDLYINFMDGVNPGLYVFVIVLFFFFIITFLMKRKPQTIEWFNGIYGLVIGLATFFTAVTNNLSGPFFFINRLEHPLRILLFMLLACPLLLLVVDQLLEKAKADIERNRKRRK